MQGYQPQRAVKYWLLSVLLVLGGCAGLHGPQSPSPDMRSKPQVQAPRVPVSRAPVAQQPIQDVRPRSTPVIQRSHPRYAPPPVTPAHWNNQLGVYVLEGGQLYYRERVYYRFDGGWFSAGRAQGPWESIPAVSVPPGLRERYR